jgi:uncharacterized protein
MNLEHEFQVEAPIDVVWKTMIDIEQVAPCLPGAEVTASEGNTYEGTFTIRLGPTTAAYAGKLDLGVIDQESRRVVMNASGRDKRGQGTAKATIESTMTESAGTTTVKVRTDFALTGRLARFGRGGMIQDVSNRLVGDFVECLQSSFASAPAEEGANSAAEEPAATVAPPRAPAKPVSAGRLFFSVLWERIKRLFRR